MTRCARCIRPDSHLGIRFDSEGVCNYCRSFEKRWKSYIDSPEATYAKKQNQLKKALAKEKRKGNKYQAILGISGGKDSAYALYLMKEKYRVNVLTFTMVTEFHREAARENVERITKAFDTDHVWTQGSSNELFVQSFKTTGRICYPCVLCSTLPFNDLAKKHDIGILLSGYSPMTDGMDPQGTSPWFLRNFTRVSDNPAVREEGELFYRKSFSYMIRTLLGGLKLFDLGKYFPWDDDAIQVLFKDKYNIEFGEEHSDCGLHELAGLCAVKKYGFTLNMSKYSKYILLGRMTREEALERIEAENESLLNPTGEEKESIDSAIARLGLTWDDLEAGFSKDDSIFRRGVMNRLVDFYRRNFYA